MFVVSPPGKEMISSFVLQKAFCAHVIEETLEKYQGVRIQALLPWASVLRATQRGSPCASGRTGQKNTSLSLRCGS